MIKRIINVSTIGFLAIFLNACGGGSGSEKSLSSLIDEGNKTNAEKYSQYSWSLNEDINSEYKESNKIQEYSHINLQASNIKTKGETINGQKIRVAVIDTDFDVNHPALKDKIIHTYNVMDGSNKVSNQNKFDKPFSHGTAIAGIIAAPYIGIAPDVELILIHIEFGDKQTSKQLINAFNKADEYGAQVINCSWNSDTTSGHFRTNLEVKTKIDELKAKGINIVFEAGDGNKERLALNLDEKEEEDESKEKYETYAELSSVIGVGASSSNNDVTKYSNYGENIDVLAPGGDENIPILVLDKVGKEGVNNALFADNNYAFAYGSGIASAHVSGVIALMLATNPSLTPSDIRKILITTATKVTGEESKYIFEIRDGVRGRFDEKRAFGKINAGAAILDAENALVK